MQKKLTEEYRLAERVRRRLREGIREFGLIDQDDHILIGVSGGKDSLALMELLGEVMRRSNGKFRLSALHVRMENVDYAGDVGYLEEVASASGVAFHVRTGCFSADRESGRSPCFLCSWNRRKIMFETARELGCNKIALGHHQDDILHTALMNLMFSGSFSTMPVRLRMRKFPMTLIRPLCKEHEADLRAWAGFRKYRPLEKCCPYETVSNRTSVRGQFQNMERISPEFRYHLWHALLKEGKLVEDESCT